MYVLSKSKHSSQTRHHQRGRILTVGRNSTMTLYTVYFVLCVVYLATVPVDQTIH